MKNKDKEIIRKMVWDSLADNNLILPPKPVHGRIPNFRGSTAAAELLKTTEEWKNSEVIFSSPDSAQKKVREYALKDKKVLIMASPKLKHGYLLINPINALNMEKTASTIDGAFNFGNPIKDFPKVDMVIEGSVAVDLEGNRLGKGGGYGDMEISHLYHQKAIDNKTAIVTTVHETQIIDKVPTEDHDKKIDMIITPKRVIKINH
jgi:5-formyltetrahydrofolate cyclo-ligase